MRTGGKKPEDGLNTKKYYKKLGSHQRIRLYFHQTSLIFHRCKDYLVYPRGFDNTVRAENPVCTLSVGISLLISFKQ